ncbi:MAG: hypothetical protein AAF717_01325 [Bacteroidota bacterium]
MKIALVELSESHEECIYSQVQFLSGSASVDLYLHPNHRTQVAPYRRYCKEIFFIPIRLGLLKKIVLAFSLARTLSRYNKVIFNTASSSKLLRNTVLFLRFFSTECIGVLHNTRKLEASFTQRIISTKIKKYLVLNDHLLRIVPRNPKVRLSSFYPIYFPPFSDPLDKPENEIWLVVPGSIDFERRDYTRLTTALKEIPRDKNLKVVILGRLNTASKDGEILFRSISEKSIHDYFITFSDFVPNEVFHSYIKHADFILPLLTLSKSYLTYKISGSFNLAFAYKKPLLCHNFFEAIPDIFENAVFYDPSSLSEVLHSLNTSYTYPKTLYTGPKWDFAFQRERYLNFINT